MVLNQKIYGVVLSGGESKRMGQPKGLLTLDGLSLIERAVFNLNAVCEAVVVAAGRHFEEIRQTSRIGLSIHRIDDWRYGMRASLRNSLKVIPNGHVLVQHIDQPGVQMKTLEQLCSGRIGKPRVLTYRGRPGHPVLIPNWLRQVIGQDDQRSLRQIFNEVGVQNVHVNDAAIARNLNRREDWNRFLFEFR